MLSLKKISIVFIILSLGYSFQLLKAGCYIDSENRRWPNGIIPFFIDADDFTDGRVERGLREISRCPPPRRTGRADFPHPALA